MRKTVVAKKTGSILLAVLLGVSGAMGSCCVMAAEAETEAESVADDVEAETEASDMAAEAETEIEVTELEITLDGVTLTIANTTGIAIASAAAQSNSSDDDAEGTSEGADDAEDASGDTEDAEADSSSDSDASGEEETAASDAALALVLTAEDGTVHTLEIADEAELEALSGLTLLNKIGFFSLTGTDANGDAKYYYETADEITLEESVTMYTTGMLTVRESADGSSEALGYVDRGSEVEVLGGTSAWLLISQGDLTGYAASRFLTTEESEAQAAVDEEANARAAQEAAAAAAAQAAAAAAAAAAASASESTSSQTETTSTENACLTGGVLN